MSDRYAMHVPVYDSLAEDEEAFADYRDRAVPMDWHDMLKAAGGRALGEPTVEEIPNLQYLWPLRDEYDQPMIDAAGEPVLNHVKLHLYVVGPAERPEEQ